MKKNISKFSCSKSIKTSGHAGKHACAKATPPTHQLRYEHCSKQRITSPFNLIVACQTTPTSSTPPLRLRSRQNASRMCHGNPWPGRGTILKSERAPASLHIRRQNVSCDIPFVVYRLTNSSLGFVMGHFNTKKGLMKPKE